MPKGQTYPPYHRADHGTTERDPHPRAPGLRLAVAHRADHRAGLRRTNYDVLYQPLDERPEGYEETADAFGIPFVGFPVQKRKRPRTGSWGHKPVWIEPDAKKGKYRVQVPNVRSWAVGVVDTLADVVQVESLPEIRINPRETSPDVHVRPVVGGAPEAVMTLDEVRKEWPVLRTAFLMAEELFQATHPGSAADLVVFREAGRNAAGEDRARAVSRRGRPGHGWFVHRQALLVGEGGRGRRRLAPRAHRAVPDEPGVRADRLLPGGERACGCHRGDGDGAAGEGYGALAVAFPALVKAIGPSGAGTGSTLRGGGDPETPRPSSTGRNESKGRETPANMQTP